MVLSVGTWLLFICQNISRVTVKRNVSRQNKDLKAMFYEKCSKSSLCWVVLFQ